MIVCNQVMKFILDKIDKDERQAAKKRKREESVEQKRSKQNASKLSALLFKHKEQLKADILKKRALLDKELQLQVQVRPMTRAQTLCDLRWFEMLWVVFERLFSLQVLKPTHSYLFPILFSLYIYKNALDLLTLSFPANKFPI